jgi:hypothetical protein
VVIANQNKCQEEYHPLICYIHLKEEQGGQVKKKLSKQGLLIASTRNMYQ